MTFDTGDKKIIDDAVEKLINSQKPADGSDTKEFLLHLYDQLWENMRSKETRLWTFLSLYGAAVGLVFAGGQTSQIPGAELFALIIVVALTTWAILIVLNANYWVQRNILMVAGIEKRYPGISAGIYPKRFPEHYKGPFDSLYRGSILVLCMLLVLVYSRTLWSYRIPTSFDTVYILLAVASVYLLFFYFTLYCLKNHEEYVWLRDATVRSRSEEASELTLVQRKELFAAEVQNRKRLDVRWYVLAVLIWASALFDFVLSRNGYTFPGLWWCIGFQGLACVLFISQWYAYRRPFGNMNDDQIEAHLMKVYSDVEEKLKPVRDKWLALQAITEAGFKARVDAVATVVNAELTAIRELIANRGDVDALVQHIENTKAYLEPLTSVTEIEAIIKPSRDYLGEKQREFEEKLSRFKSVNWTSIDVVRRTEWIRVFAILAFVSTALPVYFLWTHNPKLKEDMEGEKTVTVTDLDKQIAKAQQDLRQIEASFIELQKNNIQLQKKLVDQQIIPFQQRLENLEHQFKNVQSQSEKTPGKGAPNR